VVGLPIRGAIDAIAVMIARHCADVFELHRLGVAQPGELLVQICIVLGRGREQFLLGPIELAQLAEVEVVHIQGLVEQCLALLHQLQQLGRMRLGLRPGLHLQRELLDGRVCIRDPPQLGAMLQPANGEVGDLRLALLVVLNKGPQIG